MNTGSVNLSWARAMVKVLADSGVTHACISPGSRNTPLTLALTEQKSIRAFSQFDERSAGYFALGMAVKLHEPVILLCTSGTAAANYFPAVIEANYSRIPLIVLTADRPGYLAGTGENQTIHQKNLYGCHVRYFRDIGLPDRDPVNMTHFVFTAVIASKGLNAEGNWVNPSGPVHLNIPFEEPLIPLSINNDCEVFSPGIEYRIPVNRIDQIVDDGGFGDPGKKNLIVCGRMYDPDNRQAILNLAETLQAPILADPASQLRFWKKDPGILTSYDLFLRNCEMTPDYVIRFGAKPVSKILNQKLKEWREKTVLVDHTGRFNDDCKYIDITTTPGFCDKLIQANNGKINSPEFLFKFRKADEKYRSVVDRFFCDHPVFEGSAVRISIESLEPGDNLVLGNSMPIRQADMFTPSLETDIHVAVNRGTSGIDGVTSTAMGIAAISSLKAEPEYTMLITGDVSFFYDLSALYISRRYGMKVTIIVINNDGGQIFSLLPIAEFGSESFEEFWLTPPNMEIRKAAQLFDCRYYFVDRMSKLIMSLKYSRQYDGVTIIEIKSDSSRNTYLHKTLLDQLKTIKF